MHHASPSSNKYINILWRCMVLEARKHWIKLSKSVHISFSSNSTTFSLVLWNVKLIQMVSKNISTQTFSPLARTHAPDVERANPSCIASWTTRERASALSLRSQPLTQWEGVALPFVHRYLRALSPSLAMHVFPFDVGVCMFAHRTASLPFHALSHRRTVTSSLVSVRTRSRLEAPLCISFYVSITHSLQFVPSVFCSFLCVGISSSVLLVKPPICWVWFFSEKKNHCCWVFYVVAFVGHLRSRIFPWNPLTPQHTTPIRKGLPPTSYARMLLADFGTKPCTAMSLLRLKLEGKMKKWCLEKILKKSYVDFVEWKAQI